MAKIVTSPLYYRYGFYMNPQRLYKKVPQTKMSKFVHQKEVSIASLLWYKINYIIYVCTYSYTCEFTSVLATEVLP